MKDYDDNPWIQMYGSRTLLHLVENDAARKHMFEEDALGLIAKGIARARDSQNWSAEVHEHGIPNPQNP